MSHDRWPAAITSVAGHDFLKVRGPETFSNEALDNPTVLAAVANGVEGQFQQVYDDFVVFTGLNSDELIDSSTWIEWADVSTGRMRGDWPQRRRAGRRRWTSCCAIGMLRRMPRIA